MKKNSDLLAFLAFLVLFLIAVLLCTGCAGTVQPKEVQASLPSYAGNATSGIVVPFPAAAGSYVTNEWVVNYNQAVKDYGADPFFKHHLAANEGVTVEDDGRFWATDEAHHNYAMMETWRRDGTHRPPTLLQKLGAP